MAFAPVGFHEPGSRGGEVRMLNDGLFHLDPKRRSASDTSRPVLIEHEKGLLQILANSAPATALDSLIRLDGPTT